MKFSIISATVLYFAALSFAALLMNAVDMDDLAERTYNIDELDAHEWYVIEAHTGPFHRASPGEKNDEHEFIDFVHESKKLELASAGGSSARTFESNGVFHLDRQQPTNRNGQHKVAIQVDNVPEGKPSTIGQVVIHGGANPSAKLVAKKLKQSVKLGKETHINHPDSKKAKNIAANKLVQQAKANGQGGSKKGKKGGSKKGKKGGSKKGKN